MTTDSSSVMVWDEDQNALKRWQAMDTILSQEVPKEAIKSRPGRGGKTFKYVTHGWVTGVLNDAFGFDWDFEALPETLRLNEKGAGIFCRLTVRKGSQPVTKVEYGEKETVPGMLEGDLIKSAISDGLRRCAMRLGIGLSLYGGDMTAQDVKNMLVAYAVRHLKWDARKTFDYLKEKGFSAADLLPRSDEMYRELAAAAGHKDVEEPFDEPPPADIEEAKQRIRKIAIEEEWMAGPGDGDGATTLLEQASKSEKALKKEEMLSRFGEWQAFIRETKPPSKKKEKAAA